MASYGQMVESAVDPYKESVYELITAYFENPLATKIKDIDQYSMYMTKIQAQLGIEFRYIVIFVYKDNNQVGILEKLNNLKWISIQTRTLSDDHSLPLHTYIPKRIPRLDQRIALSRKTDRSYEYKVENLPITVTLLFKQGKNTDYNTSGTVVTALETYQTIINFV